MQIQIKLNRFVNIRTDSKEEIQTLKDHFGSCTNNGLVGCTVRQFDTPEQAQVAYKEYVTKFGNTLE